MSLIKPEKWRSVPPFLIPLASGAQTAASYSRRLTESMTVICPRNRWLEQRGEFKKNIYQASPQCLRPYWTLRGLDIIRWFKLCRSWKTNDADHWAGCNISIAATTLADKSIIDDAQSFQLLARFFGIGSDIKAGKYEFKDGVTGFQVLQKIYRGYFAKNRLRIQEGWTFTDLRKAFDDHDAILHSSAGWSQNKILDYLNISY